MRMNTLARNLKQSKQSTTEQYQMQSSESNDHSMSYSEDIIPNKHSY